jgi:exopolyphosphatase / guanosine-5'-triphosphate,3'-diphosphate pyrophosphatase
MTPPVVIDSRDVAVIDVGSNSVRLVIYRLEGRAIWTVYNEKVLAGLGREVARTGRLSVEGVAAAMPALRRFRAVIESVRPAHVYTAATAAVREAEDGREFIRRIREETGLSIDILTGEDEAHAAALGVIAGSPHAEGVVGDLGGSSLELTRIGGGEVGDGVTLALGPFAVGGLKNYDVLKGKALAQRRLGEVAADFRTPCFHAVGGAWRNLALLQMQLTGYDLHVVHQYELAAAEALRVARLVASQSRSSLDRIPGVSKKRAETLPHAAVLLESIIEQLQVERVAFSAYGLREGLIFAAMSDDLRGRDPLLEGATAMGVRFGVSQDLGPALEAWLAPAFASLDPVFSFDRDRVLLGAAARLADIGARLHPDHRAVLAFDQVLRAPIAGQTHPERAFLATAIYARHQAGDDLPQASAIRRVLSPDALHRARAVGLALRLGSDLSGRSATLLRASSLTFTDRAVILRARPEAADLLLGEQTRKRLAALAHHLELTPQTQSGEMEAVR